MTYGYDDKSGYKRTMTPEMMERQARWERDTEIAMLKVGREDALRVYAGRTEEELATVLHIHQTEPKWKGAGPYEVGLRRGIGELLGIDVEEQPWMN